MSDGILVDNQGRAARSSTRSEYHLACRAGYSDYLSLHGSVMLHHYENNRVDSSQLLHFNALIA
jgi:hypothetical protein